MSSDESSYERYLADGEPNEPRSAVIQQADGGRVVCLVTRKDRNTWIAEPPELYQLRPGDRFLIDRLPSGGTVEFRNVVRPEEGNV